MGPCRLRLPLGSSHVQNGISHAVPLFLSVRTHKSPSQVPGPPYVPESQKPSCQGFPLHLPKLLTQVNQLHLTTCSIRRELSHIGGPLRMPPLGYRLLMLHFLLHSGLTVKQGPAVSQRSSSTSLVSQYSSSLSLTTSLSEVLGSSGLQGSCSRLYSVAQTVKHLSTMWETRVLSLGREDALEKEMAIHSSTIAWEIPWTEGLGRLQSMGSQRVGHN